VTGCASSTAQNPYGSASAQQNAAVAPSGSVAPPQQQGTEVTPDATLTFSGGSVAVGVGFSWGSGVLTHKGRQHNFAANGLNVINVGASSVQATGDVFHLTKLEDFNGTYSTIGAGTTLVGGGTVGFLQNDKGVVVKFVSQTRGLQLSLPVGGARL
jgi:hypothetical protein